MLNKNVPASLPSTHALATTKKNPPIQKNKQLQSLI